MTGALAIPLAEKAKATLVSKLAPVLLRKLLVPGEVIAPVCDAIKTIACRHEILTAHALDVAVPAFSAFSGQFMQMLNESVNVSVQSSCKNYELIVQVVADAPDLSTPEKVDQVCKIEKNRVQNLNSVISNVGEAIPKALVPIILGGIVVANPREARKAIEALAKNAVKLLKK